MKADTLLITQEFVLQNFHSESENAVNFRNQLNLLSESHPSFFSSSFEEWKVLLGQIYISEELDLNLFSDHLYLLYLIQYFFRLLDLSNENMKIVNESLDFPPFFQNLFPKIKSASISLPFDFHDNIIIEFDSKDMFSGIYQQLIANTKRHHKGEFYTPFPLCEEISHKVYKIGNSVLDPSCGSGGFLIAIYNIIQQSSIPIPEKIIALNALIGIDLNPIACVMARANLLLLIIQDKSLIPFLPKVRINIFNNNTLKLNLMEFLKRNITKASQSPQSTIDLVIGNPPWAVINRIPVKSEKSFLKTLGQSFGILKGGKWASTTEITSIFIHFLLNILDSRSKLAFVIPASLAFGSQHSLFRNFSQMQDIQFWDFDLDLFPIHNHVLIFRKKSDGLMEASNTIEIDWIHYHVEKKEEQSTDLPIKKKTVIKFQSISHEKYTPLFIQQKGTTTEVGKLIPIKKVSESNNSSPPKTSLKSSESTLETVKFNFPIGKSYYHDLFRQGASLVPRNLIFVSIDSKTSHKDSDIVTIKPASTIQKKKYSSWDFEFQYNQKIEKKYIFPVAKSTGLLATSYKETYLAFLPIERAGNDIRIQEPSETLAKDFFHRIKALYADNIKKDAKITSLIERLDYGHALSNPLQFISQKLVYAGIGSISKAAILKDLHLIDTSLYYYTPSSQNEAYYLLAYLNSSLLTQNLKMIGSTGANGSLRNIHKNPFKFNFPQYESNSLIHQNLVILAKSLEKYISNLISQLLNTSPELKSKLKSIQNRIYQDEGYQQIITKIDNEIKNVF